MSIAKFKNHCEKFYRAFSARNAHYLFIDNKTNIQFQVEVRGQITIKGLKLNEKYLNRWKSTENNWKKAEIFSVYFLQSV